MLSFLKVIVRKNAPLLRLAVQLIGVQAAFLNSQIKMVVSTWFVRKPPVVFYCEIESHLQNVMDVIVEMSNAGRIVTVVTGFRPESNLLESLQGVTAVESNSRALLSIMRARLFITPCVGFPRPYSPHGSSVVHFLVSLTNLDGVFADHDFDDCDYIFCAGDHQISDFVKLSKRRNLAGKVVIPGGYPKLDSQIQWLAKHRQDIAYKKAVKVVVYAPTHVYDVNENLASLRRNGEGIVCSLLDSGFAVIFRPHPVSFTSDDKTFVEKICADHQSNPRFTLDESKNYMKSYAQADLMVTDLSGTGFTFAFTFQRPAIFFSPDAHSEAGLEGIQFNSRNEIGDVVRSLPELHSKSLLMMGNLREFETKIVLFRDRTIFNFGSSAKYFCQCLPYIERGESDKDWVVL